MSAYGELTAQWGDGEHIFRIGYKEISQFEEKFDLPFMAFIGRIAQGQATFPEMREIVRLGLIGGGLEAPKATSLVQKYVEEYPPSETMDIALQISHSGAFGSKEYREKKAKAKSTK